MNERRDGGRWGGRGPQQDGPPRRPEPRRDAGAYIGRRPERANEGHREGSPASDDAVKEAGQNH